MAARKSYLVAVDFSKTAEFALDHALKLSRENKAALILLHIIDNRSVVFGVPGRVTPGFYIHAKTAAAEEAKAKLRGLLKKKKLGPKVCRALLVRHADPALAISKQANKLKVSMIIMGSRGRTGIKHLVLGSVAERILHYAHCPVLIVKK